MAGFLAFNSRFSSMNFDWNILLSVQLQNIYSHLRECTKIPWESLTSMVISLALVNSWHQWLVIKWFLPCLTSRNCNHMVRFKSLRVRLEDLGLSDIFTQVVMEFFFESYYTDPSLYWSWLFYHLIMDLCLFLVAMIVFSWSLLPWIYNVLVGNHVMSHVGFDSVIL